MVKSLVLAVAIVPSVMAINTDGGLYSSFVSLSIELIGFPDWAGSRSNANEYSNNLIESLVSAQGSPMVVRVGGNSADRAIYDETLTTPTASSCPKADPGAYQCIGPKFFDSYGAFPQGTLYSHNFNVATWNSSGFHTLEATVPLACNALRGQLALYEIGNEPDLYNGKRRDSDYNVHDYLADWTNTTGRFESYLQAACPDMVKNLQYMFPSVSSPGSRLRVPDMYKAATGDSLKHVTQVSVHNYMAGATQPGVTLQATLMNHTAVARSIAGHLAAGTFLANSSSALQVKTLDLGGRADLDSGYGTYVEGRLERIAILNLREYDSSSGKGRGMKEYAVKVEPSSHWTVKRLSAPGARDKTGVTFNGFAYEAETMGKPKRVDSRPSNEQLKANKCGKLVVKVADSEAVVLVQS
ncbi:hypothetical protein LLEC1_04824 [Akanthomyces lecanii]|uniref:Beta-glucuronidase C-terminal domain-containing protein n=1 Tax=Cordyceps confragosa TaxID=2714763 RepID=A0A179I3H8_CORDF|nr:hypothetical protein LLEC1_04824 [Akanthomyces lecanii]